MDLAHLRATQTPIKESARREPEAALVTLNAERQTLARGVPVSIDVGNRMSAQALG